MTSYPHHTGFVRHSDTSAASAKMLDESGNAQTYDFFILGKLKELGINGATAEELRKFLNHSHPHLHNGTVNGRLSTLWRRGDVVKCTMTRLTDAKRQSHVYVHDDYRYMVAAEPEYSEVKNQNETLHELATLLYQAVVYAPAGGGVAKITPLEMSVINRLAHQAGISRRSP